MILLAIVLCWIERDGYPPSTRSTWFCPPLRAKPAAKTGPVFLGLIPHSLQPSFFRKISCFPWGSDDFLERSGSLERMGKCPLEVHRRGLKRARPGCWSKTWRGISLHRTGQRHALASGCEFLAALEQGGEVLEGASFSWWLPAIRFRSFLAF